MEEIPTFDFAVRCFQNALTQRGYPEINQWVFAEHVCRKLNQADVLLISPEVDRVGYADAREVYERAITARPNFWITAAVEQSAIVFCLLAITSTHCVCTLLGDAFSCEEEDYQPSLGLWFDFQDPWTEINLIVTIAEWQKTWKNRSRDLSMLDFCFVMDKSAWA